MILGLNGKQADVKLGVREAICCELSLGLLCSSGRVGSVTFYSCVSFCRVGGWCSDPAGEVMPCEGSCNQVPLFRQVDISGPVEYAGRLATHLVCCSIDMLVCVLLSLRLFTAFLVEKRQPNLSAACRLAGLPPRCGGIALSGSSRLKRGVCSTSNCILLV